MTQVRKILKMIEYKLPDFLNRFQSVANNLERCLTFVLSYLVYSQIFLWMIAASATTQKCRITHCKKTLQGFLMDKTFQTLIEQVFISINQKTVICNEPKVLVQWLWIRSWSHTYMFMMLEVIKPSHSWIIKWLQWCNCYYFYQCLFRSARRNTLKMLWKTLWFNPYAWWGATCMLGEDNWTSKNTKGWSVSKCRTQFYPFIALHSFFTWTRCWCLYWIGSSQEHDLDTRLHTSWRFTPFIGQGIALKKPPQHFQTSINQCKFTRASEVCFCEFI